MSNSRQIIVAMMLVAQSVATGRAQEDLHLRDTTLSIVPSDSKVAIQFNGDLEPLQATTFLGSHAYIVDTIPPDTLSKVESVTDSTGRFETGTTPGPSRSLIVGAVGFQTFDTTFHDLFEDVENAEVYLVPTQ